MTWQNLSYTMWITSQSPATTSKQCLLAFFLLSCIHYSIAMPQNLATQQSSLSDLQLPQCALKCYLDNLLKDGCVTETDFACHCAAGNIIDRSKSCISQGCNRIEAADGIAKVKAACKTMIGGGNGGNGNEMAIRSSSAAASSPTSGEPRTSTPFVLSSPPSQPSVAPSQSIASLSQFPTASGFSTMPNPMTRSAMTTPTGIPLAPIPQSDNQLSKGAKAGISISVIFVALSAFFALGWYIRRLKRDLRTAQAATRRSHDSWLPQSTTSTAGLAPIGISRSRSWTRGRRSSREDPVSPLSPRSMAEITTVTNNGYGVLKKKRGNVLSIVVERSEGDETSLMNRSIQEPVPGQKEGLSGPLELDGEWTGVVEMPLAVTPRNRSLDRDRDRDMGRLGSGGKSADADPS